MTPEKDSEKYFKDMKEWQDKQYIPGSFLGGHLPFPLRQLGKKNWLRYWSLAWLIILGIGIAYGIWQMVVYFMK